jgi:hypothetical protein
MFTEKLLSDRFSITRYNDQKMYSGMSRGIGGTETSNGFPSGRLNLAEKNGFKLLNKTKDNTTKSIQYNKGISNNMMDRILHLQNS